jgi:hypothetical protein
MTTTSENKKYILLVRIPDFKIIGTKNIFCVKYEDFIFCKLKKINNSINILTDDDSTKQLLKTLYNIINGYDVGIVINFNIIFDTVINLGIINDKIITYLWKCIDIFMNNETGLYNNIVVIGNYIDKLQKYCLHHYIDYVYKHINEIKRIISRYDNIKLIWAPHILKISSTSAFVHVPRSVEN